MPKKILIILGNPARERQSFCEALANAYKDGAVAAGHEVEILKIAELKFDPILHEGYKAGQEIEPDIVAAQEKMAWADRWVFVYPLWQFMLPALLKGFLERTITKGFAFDFDDRSSRPIKALAGKTAHIIQTMGMPETLYRCVYGQHSQKALRNILNLCGIRTLKTVYCGLADAPGGKRRQRYLDRVSKLGNS